jgi:nitrate/nitrite transporter NarK
VALGGRFGAVLAPVLTAWLIVAFASSRPVPKLSESDILDRESFLSLFDSDREFVSTKDLDIQRRQFVQRFTSELTPSQREQLLSSARLATATVDKRKSAANAASNQNSPTTNENSIDFTHDQNQLESLRSLIEMISTQMSLPEFIDFDAIPVKLPSRGNDLLEKQKQGQSLTESETILLNRVALETLFRSQIRKSLGAGWRPTVIVYGVGGILVAIAFFAVVRNSPRLHPWCNEDERKLIDGTTTEQASAVETLNPPFPFKALITDLSLWGNSLCQFMTNLGWFFVVSYLPRYLDEVHGVPLVLQGYMTGVTSGVGIVFLFAGGRCTDWCVRKVGLKWGRRAPLVGSRFVGAAGCLLCILLGITITPSADKSWLPWLYVIGLGIAASATDFGSPAIWSYAQDVGGKYTASILGWGNMWGNIGAAVAPLVYNACLGEKPSIDNWNTVFGVCCGAFVFSGLFALLMDASKMVTVESSAKSANSEA